MPKVVTPTRRQKTLGIKKASIKSQVENVEREKFGGYTAKAEKIYSRDSNQIIHEENKFIHYE